MNEKIICSTSDSIKVLSLNIRVFNALRRSKIRDIGELIVLNDDQLFAVHNLGGKGVAEIREQLSKVELLDAPPSAHENEPLKEWSREPQILIDLGPPMIPRHEVVEWQQMMLVKQIEARTLHPQMQIDGYTLAELMYLPSRTAGLYKILLKILTAPISVAQELEQLFNIMPPREMDILLRRFGFERQTLQMIASVFGITRERVRQLERQARGRVQPVASSLPLVRIRSAFLFADDMDLSFDDWSNSLLNTGLLGDWPRERFSDVDKIQLLIVVFGILEDATQAIEIPESLKWMLQLNARGLSTAPARMLKVLESFSGATERLVMRHLRYSGAVSLDWLANQDGTNLSSEELRLVLEYKSFFRVGENWFMSLEYAPNEHEYFSVLHRSLLKMFQYCGPLSVRDIYFGIERALVKTDFPIPPLNVVEEILENHGYAFEDDLWFWPGDASEELNTGETAIWETIHELGGVAHHSQLMQAILDSGLAGASLHGTLRRSPLFDKFDQALYKLRGTHPEHIDVERARSAANMTRVDLSVQRDTYGNITVGANLGILAIANGTIVSERLPNLEGIWQCRWGDGESLAIRVTHNEIRGLLSVVRFLDCELGDRILLTFNVLDRTVAAKIIEGDK